MSIEICNVRIFDGIKMIKQNKVVMEKGLISDKTKGDVIIDGNGGLLLPGLIDSHVHLNGIENLRETAKWGITTMLDMAAPSPGFVNALKNKTGLTDILTCYTAALYPVEDAEIFVKEQVELGADYIKIIIEDPPFMAPGALEPGTIKAIVESAHNHGKLVFAHAATLATFKMAVNANVDVVTHIPLEAQIPQYIIDEMKSKGTMTVPTMVMMKEMVRALKNRLPNGRELNFDHVKASVRSLIKSGVPVIAGTDSNHSPYAPAHVSHGISLHDELALYVEAGMTPVEALQSATSSPAKAFELNDRGMIEAGRRADLLLVEGDPLLNIHDTKKVKDVWIAGVQVSKEGVSL